MKKAAAGVVADALGPAGARQRSRTRSRRSWCLLGALWCLLGAVHLALAGMTPSVPPSVSSDRGEDVRVSVCAMQHYTPGTPGTSAWPGGTCRQNDVVLALSDASRAWVTFPMYTSDDEVPATVYLRQHNGHWRSFVTCGAPAANCGLPLRSIFQGVGLTLRAGMTYDVGVYQDADFFACDYPATGHMCTPAPAEPGLPLSFTITAKTGQPLPLTITAMKTSWFDIQPIRTALLWSSLVALLVVLVLLFADHDAVILALALASLAAVPLAPRVLAAGESALEAMRYRVAIGDAHVTLDRVAIGGAASSLPTAVRGATTYVYDVTWRDHGASGFYAVSLHNVSTDDARIMATAYAQAARGLASQAHQTFLTGGLWVVEDAAGPGTCNYAAGGSRGRDAFIVWVWGSTCGTLKARALAVEKAVLARL
jgi:hypothetical protein